MDKNTLVKENASALESLETLTGKKFYVKKRKKEAPWSQENHVLATSTQEYYRFRGMWYTLAELENKLDNVGGLLGIPNQAKLKFALDTGFILDDIGLIQRPDFDSVLLEFYPDFEGFILECLEQAKRCKEELNEIQRDMPVNLHDSSLVIASTKVDIAVLDFVILREELVRTWLTTTHGNIIIDYCLSSKEVDEVIEAQTKLYMETACHIIAKHVPERRGGKDRFN